MPKRTIKINIKLPSGITATDKLVSDATKAAEKVVESASSGIAEAQRMAKEFSRKGVIITPEEILQRMQKPTAAKRAAKKKSKKTGARKRVVLTEAQRNAAAEDLKGGMTVAKTASKYGVSTATVMNIKNAAGLTKKRK